MHYTDFTFLAPFMYMLPFYTREDHSNNIKDVSKFCQEHPYFAINFLGASSTYIAYLRFFKKEEPAKVAESGENVMTWTRKDLQELL